MVGRGPTRRGPRAVLTAAVRRAAAVLAVLGVVVLSLTGIVVATTAAPASAAAPTWGTTVLPYAT
jgi:hypothetical protein